MTTHYFNHILHPVCLNNTQAMPMSSIIFCDATTLNLSHFNLAHLLSPFELSVINKRKSPKAKQEYLATRLLLKYLVKKTMPHYAHVRTNTISSAFHAPSSKLQLHIENNAVINCCISHSHGFVGAALNPTRSEFGFDIEQVNLKRPFEKLANHFYHPDEVNLISEPDNEHTKAERFFRIWTLKEALAKATSRPVAKLLSPSVFTELSLSKLYASSTQFNGFDISVVNEKSTDWRCFLINLEHLIFE
jgi:4'-phosphopantetheinyl transferase